jgi:hypothetical protein
LAPGCIGLGNGSESVFDYAVGITSILTKIMDGVSRICAQVLKRRRERCETENDHKKKKSVVNHFSDHDLMKSLRLTSSNKATVYFEKERLQTLDQ